MDRRGDPTGPLHGQGAARDHYTGQKPSLLVVDRAAFEKDLGEPRLLAFALIDEPSNLKPGGTGITYEGVTWRPEEIDAIARDWSLGKKPLWINHVGNHVNNKYLEKIMFDYADSPFIDWLSHGCYPIAGGDDLLLDLDGYTSSQQGHAIDRLSGWSGGKPQFSIIGLTQFTTLMDDRQPHRNSVCRLGPQSFTEQSELSTLLSCFSRNFPTTLRRQSL